MTPPTRRGRLCRSVLSACALATALVLDGGAQEPAATESAQQVEESAPQQGMLDDPRTWMPADELLRFKVEISVGPVRGLDVGSVQMRSVVAPGSEDLLAGDGDSQPNGRRLVGTIETLAKGGYLGHEVVHSYDARWYVGTQPRIELLEKMRGSRTKTHELSIGEGDGRWQLEYRSDRHCKGCDNPGHLVKGVMPWSKWHHCEDCERPEHHVWRDYKYFDVPADSVDIVSALYLARGLLRSGQQEVELHLINQDELWAVRLRLGGTRRLSTDAGEFDCVKVLIGPSLAGGEELGEEGSKRFEALFGLHGDIAVWIERSAAFPVVIEGTAPFGPFDVNIKASLTHRRGG